MLCLLLVLTNDLHQLVFSFPEGAVWTDDNTSYAFGYYFVLGWEILCALAAFVIMLIKCRLSQRKKYLPFLLLACSIGYALILRLICDGLEYDEIAHKLGIAERTVKYHVSNILSKTGYANRTRLAIAVTNKKFIIPNLPEEHAFSTTE